MFTVTALSVDKCCVHKGPWNPHVAKMIAIGTCLDILSAFACIFGIVAVAISFKAVPLVASYTLIGVGGFAIALHSTLALVGRQAYLKVISNGFKAFCR